MIRVRRLNSQGLEYFRKYLNALKEETEKPPPFNILYDQKYSEELQGQAKVEKTKFQNRVHVIKYLSEAMGNMDTSITKKNMGLWSWLSLFYFDQVCPESLDGDRKPGMEYRHIPDVSFRCRHRHLLAGPFQTYKTYGEKAQLLLYGDVHMENQVHHELAGRQNFITSPKLIEVANALYFDKDQSKPKPGILSKTKGGSLLRFIDVIQQLELNFDLYSTGAGEIISLLPDEFDRPQSLGKT